MCRPRRGRDARMLPRPRAEGKPFARSANAAAASNPRDFSPVAELPGSITCSYR